MSHIALLHHFTLLDELRSHEPFCLGPHLNRHLPADLAPKAGGSGLHGLKKVVVMSRGEGRGDKKKGLAKRRVALKDLKLEEQVSVGDGIPWLFHPLGHLYQLSGEF